MSSSKDNITKQLIERAKSGDERAIAQLYERHVEQIYRYIAYRTPDSDVEDLTAEVFLRMIEGLKDFVYTGAPFEAWLYRIAAARVADFHRRSNREVQEMPDTIEDPNLAPEEFLQQKQDMRDVRIALRKLSDDEQTLLILRFVERRNHQYVADVLGKSLAAVRTMQHRALHRLANLLDANGKERHYLRGEEEITPETED